MSEYSPDKWSILKMKDGVYKVLAGWSGGYLDSDSWKVSSGLLSIEEDGDYYLMHNHSGSVYRCHKQSEGMTHLSASIYSKIQEECSKAGYEVKTVTVEEFNKATQESDSE